MKILFAADVSFNYIKEFDSEKAKQVMGETAEQFRQADYSMLNLENILNCGDGGEPIIKSGPNLISEDSFIGYIDVLKPTVIGLANNHAGDYGENVLMNTIELLKRKGYLCVGAGADITEAYKPVILSKDNISAAIFAVCENEFGVAEDNRAGAAGYSLSLITESINKAKEAGHIPVIYFHGGNEKNPFPSPKKTELYRHFIDLGAKAVIAMHTHCPQGYEFYKDCPIVYSMGNFFFPTTAQQLKSWNYGYMTELSISENGITIDIIPYEFDFNKHSILEADEKEQFMKYIEHIRRPINDAQKISEYFDSWCIIAGINNYINHLTVPENVQEADARDVRHLRNLFSCEAHNELMTNTICLLFDGKLDKAQKNVKEIECLQGMKLL